jgi:hypothetical protein
MRTLIKDSRTTLAAACLLLFAICLELHWDPVATQRERATGSSLRASSVNVHMTLNRLPAGKRGLSSVTGRRFSSTELAPAAKTVPLQLQRLAETVNYLTAFANRVPERRPFSIRPPPAA